MNILVTGGASGLGEAITKTLAADPSNHIYFTYCKSADNAKAIADEYENTKSIRCDFSVESDIDSLLGDMDAMNLQVLINNAITGLDINYFHKQDPGIFLEGFQKNIIPVIRLTGSTIGFFRKQKFGKIITVLSSAVVDKPPVGWSEYVAGKSYLLSLSKSWAVENAAFNISSNCISPSFMPTSLTKDTDERVVEEMIAKHPLKVLLKPVEVAEAVSFYVKASQQVNGTNLIINAAQNVI